jgi:outer membrane receptor protein involved in Fe transport
MSRRVSWLGGVSAVLLVCALVFTLVPAAFAQETTGGMKGYVKDKSGASVPKAEVELTSEALIVPKKAVADNAGYFYFSVLPPGSYTLTVTANGFRTYKQIGIPLTVGALPTIDINMEIGTVAETVEVTGRAPIVDVTTSKVAVTITESDIDNLPKGRSYQSVISLAPGARQEPLQSSRTDRLRQDGFQVDGASDSENTYLVEGMDTSEIQGGGIKQNVVFEFVQEVQVKTSGTEAEYGGEMGGVVNVIQKRGSNSWHGSLVAYYRGDSLDANDQCATTPQPVSTTLPSGQQLNCGQRYDPSTKANTNPALGPVHDQAVNYYIQQKDKYSVVEPGYTIGGPLLKDKLWLFSSYIPTIDRTTRKVNFTSPSGPGPHAFTRSYTAHNMLNRLDYQPFSKLHLYSGWQYGYSRITGQLPALPDSVTGQANPIAGNNPANYRPDTGSVNPSNIFNFGGDWTPNSRTVVGVRYGYFYYNSEDRGLPAGIRDVYQFDLTQGVTASPVNGSIIVPNGAPPSQTAFVGQAGTQNISSNLTTQHDIFSRKTFASDVSYSATKWGQHNFKFGYGFNRLANNVFQGINTALTNVFWGTPYVPSTPAGVNTCLTVIEPYNQTNYGGAAPGPNTACAGLNGYFTIRDGIVTNGNASSYNHGIYGQDSWSVGHGLTLNLGIRFDKEFLPAYSPGNPSISFDFTQKVAPRIGAAYDLLHNGKVKVYFSYGKFYDIMKYSLPRGSFGGDYWHDCVYAMDFVNITTITPTSPGGHACGPTSAPAAGVTVGRFIENINWRAPAGNPADPGVDPNLNPTSQHEYLVGTDWAINNKMGLAVRYARKRLDNAIEDQSIDDSVYYIGNPGPNTYSNLLHRALPADGFTQPICPTCPNAPKATRRYDGLESRLTYRSSKLVALVSYTYSRFTGNYPGLTDTEIVDGNGGRHNANNNRSFDLPEMQYTTTGKVMDGVLPTDRPNVINFSGYYLLKWFGQETTFGLTQSIAQGTPKSTCVPVVDSVSSCQFYDQRGTFATFAQDPTTGLWSVTNVDHNARMPWFTQTDFNLGHSFGVSKKNEAMRLAFDFNATNILNQHAILSVSPTPFGRGNQWLSFSDNSALGTNVQKFLTGYDLAKEANAQGGLVLNSRYGTPILLQNARTLRLGVKFVF